MGIWQLVFLGIVILVTAECIREVRTFRVTRYQISSSKLKNGKRRTIVLLSDLHNCSYGKDNGKLLQAIRNEKPALILVAGDMIVGKEGATLKPAQDLMEQLPEICDTYYANGNHEQRMKQFSKESREAFETYKAELKRAGVHYLENEKTEISWDGCSVEVSGLEVPDSVYEKFQKMALPKHYLEKTLGKADKSKYQILIAHNPVFMEDYLEWGADLIVSGHLHGGVARIPFWRGVITPQGGLFPKYSGEMTKVGDAFAVVSKGIGIHTIKLRFLNPTEMVVLHVGGTEE